MGTRLTCDFRKSKKDKACGKAARHKIDMLNGVRGFRLWVCGEHVKELERALLAMGFTPFAKTGDKERKAYVAESGTPFSTNDAREWLQNEGYDVPAAGRLSGTMLQIYADAH